MNNSSTRLYELAKSLDNVDSISDIYEYVNREWLDENSNFTNMNIFTEIQDTIDERIKEIIRNDDGLINRVYDRIYNNYYLNGTNDVKDLGDFPQIIKLIDEVENLADFGYTLGALEVLMTNPVFSSFANQDPEQSHITRYTMISPKPLLPSPVMYIDTNYENIQQGFIKHADDVAELYNSLVDDEYKIDTDSFGLSVYNFSFYLTLLSNTEKNKNIDEMYSKTNVEKFVKNIEDNDVKDFWSNYFSFIKELGDEYASRKCMTPGNCVNIIDEFVVYNPKYFENISKILQNDSLWIIKNYCIYVTIKNYCSIALKSFNKLKDEYNSLFAEITDYTLDEKVLNVTTEILKTKPLGYLVESEYAQLYGSKEINDDINRMIDNIKDEMKKCINESNIFGSNTKYEGINKLMSMRRNVGYPEKSIYDINGKDGKKVIDELLHRSDELLTMFMFLATISFETEFIDRIINNSYVNERNRWNMSIYEPNAYYDPRINGFAIPLGILNYPIYDINMSDAEKYGKIGMVISHEMSHGFDNRGSEYDSTGNKRDWWDDNDRKMYDEYAQSIVQQYDKYGVNGKKTLGENISDIIGLNLSYRAFINSGTRTIYDKRVFFMSYAKLWRSNLSEELQELKSFSSPHSPAKYRVWVSRNMDEFYDVIPINKDADMFLEKEYRIKPFYYNNIVLDVDKITYDTK